MNNDKTIYKIWRILYPLIIYFLMDVIIVWAVEALIRIPPSDDPTRFMTDNAMAIASAVFLAVSVPVLYQIYKRDYNIRSSWLNKKPGYVALLVLTGALASHGFSILVTMMGLDNLTGDYHEIQNTVFAASPVLVVLQTVILAPLSEELLFRGIIFKRLEGYFGKFWLPAVISSALFGIYHMNLAQGVFAFLFGFLSCAVYEKLKNLIAPVAVHAGGNLLALILVYAGLDYEAPYIYIPVMAVCLAGSAALYYFFIRPVKQ